MLLKASCPCLGYLWVWWKTHDNERFWSFELNIWKSEERRIVSVLNLMEVVSGSISSSRIGNRAGVYFRAPGQQSVPGALVGESIRTNTRNRFIRQNQIIAVFFHHKNCKLASKYHNKFSILFVSLMHAM
ncbi:unnamed protein product [Vicia faba]|uniref:Uncharacterized protein n=1 Tax=Vicia faba TaxID=3906 RepID=A0AAV0YGN9_VICFA|nr:unnamed protein product [Vicia faba]